MESDQLTIAIPVYNKLEFFREALASARAQTVSVHIIVVDNCSDHSEFESIVAQTNDPRVRYWRNASNLGMEGNWNACIEHCRTPFVSILHDDDALHPRFVETWLADADHNRGVWASACAIAEQNPFSAPASHVPHETHRYRSNPVKFRRFAYATLSPFPGVVFPTDTQLRFDANRHGAADYYFWYRLAQEYPAYYTRSKLAFYRRSSIQASSKLVDAIVRQLFDVRRQISSELHLDAPYTWLDAYTRLRTIETYENFYSLKYAPTDNFGAEVQNLRKRFTSPLSRLACRALLRMSI